MPQFLSVALPTPPASGPTLTTAPQLIGLAIVGRPITYTPGVFSASETITLYLQWTMDGVDIVGETGPTYTPSVTDVGKHLALKEIASTGYGEDYVALTMSVTVLATPSSASPSAPTFVTAVPQSAGQVLVSWVSPETAADGSPVASITNYMVYRSATQGQAKLGGTGSTAVTVVPINNSRLLTGLSAGTYYIAVSAINANGEGWESPEVSATVT